MISVCIATYNGAKYLPAQLESILQQLSPDDEVVISDDHSSDDTLEQAQRIATAYPTPLHIVYNPGSSGYVRNFEHALRQAKGDYIFLADQDDIWCDDKIKRCLSALQEYAVVAHDAQVVDEHLQVIHPSYYAQRHPFHHWWGTMLRFSHLGCCMCFRREVLQKALPFPPDATLCTHDNWLYLVGETFFSAHVLHEPLIQYRRHQQNTSLGGNNAHKPLFFRLHYRLYLLYQLLRKAFQ